MGPGLRKSVLLVLILALLCSTCLAYDAGDLSQYMDEAISAQKALAGLDETQMLLDQGAAFPAGTNLCDWAAIALACSGAEDAYDTYLSGLAAYVTEKYATEDLLHRSKATEWARIALTVLALGGDPTNFGTAPDGTPVNLIADGTYQYVHEDLGLQGANGWIYALLALDAGGYEVPEGSKYTRQDLMDHILQAQQTDGGFCLSGSVSDVDITAMALQALAPYQDDQSVSDATQKALDYLSAQQTPDGDFTNAGQTSAESTAQTILALCALGIDPTQDARFVKGDSNALTGLLRYCMEDGSFAHTLQDGAGDFLPTEQAVLAMAALQQLWSGESGRIYDFTQYTPPASGSVQQPADEDASAPDGQVQSEEAAQTARSGSMMLLAVLAAAAVLAVAAGLVLKRKKR